MHELKPYRTMNGLRNAIDNGGRFYNFFTDAGDEVVTRAELAKAAGVFTAGVNAFLFLEMAQQDLQPHDRESILDMLEPGLRGDYRRGKPQTLRPSEIESQGTAGRSVIATGFPRFVEDKTQFTGFVMIPIMIGSVTTFTMIPIFDQFDVYEVFDDRRMRNRIPWWRPFVASGSITTDRSGLEVCCGNSNSKTRRPRSTSSISRRFTTPSYDMNSEETSPVRPLPERSCR